jgi:hypothetical protein
MSERSSVLEVLPPLSDSIRLSLGYKWVPNSSRRRVAYCLKLRRPD